VKAFACKQLLLLIWVQCLLKGAVRQGHVQACKQTLKCLIFASLLMINRLLTRTHSE
jgi:hypothetical protein